MINILDFGTSKICGISVVQDENESKILGFSSIVTSGLKNGSIINMNETSRAVSLVLKDLENQSCGKIKNIYASFSGEQISSVNSLGQSEILDKEVSYRDMEKALRMSIAMDVPEDKRLLNVIPSHYIIDGQSGILDPRGMSGVKLEVRSHLIYCPKNSISNISKSIFDASRLRVKKFFFNQLGTQRSVLSKEQLDSGVCLIDIGAGTTDLTICKSGSMVFSKVFPYAGDYITEALAMSLKISSSQAEEIKKKYGSATAFEVEEENIKISGVQDLEEIIVSRRTVAEIIENALSKILRSCMNCIDENGFKNNINAGIQITGGTANLQNIDKLGSSLSQTKFSIGMPCQNLPANSEKIINPQYSSLIGMAKFCHEEEGKEFTFSQSKGIIARVLEWIRSEL
ncbi:cell division protein FtsA [SAR86 cluster bacterium]|jgi:cell division protein FtsA|nr:cell division protein FtsA [SAR86 cluster bacterium]